MASKIANSESGSADEVRRLLRDAGNPEIAAHSARFFKTGPGQYAEGDLFIGVRVPVQRAIARLFRTLPMAETVSLLRSPVHEERLTALIVMTAQAAKGDRDLKKRLYDAYLANVSFVNNWDLVDTSAPTVVGGHLIDRSRKPLYKLSAAKSQWERRIAVLAAGHFIKSGDFGDLLQLSERLLGDREDLIHKAVGWMLRELAKRDQPAAEEFLVRHQAVMPRTMLRYAIEKFPEPRRQAYLDGAAKLGGRR